MSQFAPGQTLASAVEEINWSYQSFVPPPKDRQSANQSHLSLDFIRKLIAATRTTAVADLQPLHTPVSLFDWALKASVEILFQWYWISLVVAFLCVSNRASWAAAITAAVLGATFYVLVFSITNKRGTGLIAAFRTVFLLVFSPAIFWGTLALTRRMFVGVVVLATMVGSAYSLASLISPFAAPDKPPFPDANGIPVYDQTGHFLFAQVAMALLFLVIGAIATAVLAIVYSRLVSVIAPLLKIAADVVLYLGDPGYRLELWQFVAKSTEASLRSGTTRLVYLGHSLGSVIAVDFLSRVKLQSSASILLVTGGSPLRRLLHRFFPSRYPEPIALSCYLDRLHEKFTWINVYRPNDPIGADLGLGSARDHSTGQETVSPARAHIGYWSDARVHDIVRGAVKNSPFGRGDRYLGPVDRSKHPATPQRVRGYSWLPLFFAISLTAAFAHVPWLFVADIKQAEDDIARLKSVSVPEPAILFARASQRAGGGDRGLITVRAYEFEVLLDRDRSTGVRRKLSSGSVCDLSVVRDRYTNRPRSVTSAGSVDLGRDAFISVDVLYAPGKRSLVALGECVRPRVRLVEKASGYVAAILGTVLLGIGWLWFTGIFLHEELSALAGLLQADYEAGLSSRKDGKSALSFAACLVGIPFALAVQCIAMLTQY